MIYLVNQTRVDFVPFPTVSLVSDHEEEEETVRFVMMSL